MKYFYKTSKLLILLLFIVSMKGFSQDTITQSSAEISNFQDFKITTWNVEWLSCLSAGPGDRELQINNVVSLIKTMNSDLVALQEVGTSNIYTTIDTLVRRLGNEWEGKIAPWHANNCSQNQGIVYKKSKIKLINASLVKNGGSSYNWSSGRFPAMYEVNFLLNNKKIQVFFINIHAKAYADVDSYVRRRDASMGLKNFLDDLYYDERVVIIGDFNDYLEGTTCWSCGGISPYKNFIDDVNSYKGITKSLATIDHVIISHELFDNYVENSAFREISATQTIPNYHHTTSDHIPTSFMFRISDGVNIDGITRAQSFHYYPNPTTGELIVKISDMRNEIYNIEIYDIYGKKHLTVLQSYDLTVSKIDIAHLSAGIYFLRVNGETVKVVKN